MPIRPENKNRYPKNWKEIRDSILARANNRCEKCGLENYSWGYRCPVGGRFFQAFDTPEAAHAHGLKGPIRIILTIAHLDHTPENCSPENLRAWCQQCHNRYDAPIRAKNRKEREANERQQLEK